MKLIRFLVDETCLRENQNFGISVIDLLHKGFNFKSKNEVRNLIKSGGAKIQDFKVNSIFARIKLATEQDRKDFDLADDFFVLVDAK